jgi:ectoine hydroxylase
MKLTSEQLQTYENQGYLFSPNLFSQAEVNVMKGELPRIYADAKLGTIVEKDGTTIRMVFGVHTYNPIFNSLGKQARIVEPAMQILDSQVYIHQFHINAKKALTGDTFPWHQDYAYHHEEDGIPTPRVMIAIIFLDEVHEFNSPLMLIPHSHQEGLIAKNNYTEQHSTYKDDPDWMANVTSDDNYAIDLANLKRLEKKYGIVAPKGSAGSILFLHPNCIHASGVNMYPFDRSLVVIIYNSTENLTLSLENPRPEFMASSDYTPIEILLNQI